MVTSSRAASAARVCGAVLTRSRRRSVRRIASDAASFFTGQIVTGPTTVTYHVDALAAGTFFFHCDIHPTLMFGTFVVR